MPELAGVRLAGPADAAALAGLEREANLVALAHVFGDRPFPSEVVLARWRELLARPDVTTEVAGTGPPNALVCHDTTRVRHLAVHPDHWGHGLAGLLLDRAVERIRAGGARPVLWCLVANTRARGLYEHRGWTPSGVERRGEFEPFPTEMEYHL